MLSIREALCIADDTDNKTVILPPINPYPSILYSKPSSPPLQV